MPQIDALGGAEYALSQPRTAIGLGSMQLTGPGVLGPPPNWSQAIHLLQKGYEWGVRVIDSAWYYGPMVTHKLICEAFQPWPSDLLVITKLGNSRDERGSWVPVLDPDNLEEGCNTDLRLLAMDSLPLSMLRWNPTLRDDDAFTIAFAKMVDLVHQGKVQRIGLSNIQLRHLQLAQQAWRISAVSNRYSLLATRGSDVLEYCAAHEIAFLPYYPFLGGEVLRNPRLQKAARQLAVSTAQLALAWLRAQSPVVVPIPGTASLQHLQENIAGQQLTLTPEVISELDFGLSSTEGRQVEGEGEEN